MHHPVWRFQLWEHFFRHRPLTGLAFRSPRLTRLSQLAPGSVGGRGGRVTRRPLARSDSQAPLPRLPFRPRPPEL